MLRRARKVAVFGCIGLGMIASSATGHAAQTYIRCDFAGAISGLFMFALENDETISRNIPMP